MALAIDVTDTGDTPRALPKAVEMGKGPAIKLQDSGMIVDPRVKEWMIKRAREAQIPYQLEILRSGTTDAQAIQISRDGIPTGSLSVPCRYIHSPSEMVDMADVENSVRLLVELVKKSIVISDE